MKILRKEVLRYMIKSELLRRNVPDFFIADNKKITSLGEWEKHRTKLKSLFLSEEYGHLPPKLTPKIETTDGELNFADKVTWETIGFTFENEGKSHTVKADLLLPRDKTGVPVFISIGFKKEVPNKYLPLEEIIDNGFGVFHFYYENVTSDDGDFENGLAGLFTGAGKEFGKISLWSYFASFMMDYLETRIEVDKNNVAIIGHSRLGKTALLTSALDERFVLTCVNESGCCGASLSRGKVEENETIVKITDTFPFWFKESYLQYRDNEDALPFDQHMLLALVAPRNVVVGGAFKDVWADNEGQMLSAYLASYAWELYGKDGLICGDALPKVGDKFLDGNVGFYLRDGSHFLSRDDWHVYMTKFKEILNKQ